MSRLKKVLSLYWFVYSFKASSKLVPEIKRQFCTAFHFHPRSSQPRHAWWWTSNMMFGVMLLTISQSHSILLILWLHYGKTKCCDMMSSIIWYFFPSLIHIKCVNEIVSLTIFSGVSWIEFLNSRDYLKKILALLREGNLSRAQYLWFRHEVHLHTTLDMYVTVN